MSVTWRGWLLLSLLVFPWLSIFIAGLWWLWENQWWVLWGTIAALTSLLFGAARRWWLGQLVVMPDTSAANPQWSPREEETWDSLQPQIQALEVEAYAFDKQLPDKLLHLSLDLSLEVAQRYHIDREEPRLAVPLPELLHAAERVCRDLRQLSGQVPFSHAITAEQLFNLHDYYKRYGEPARNTLRLGGLLINPQVQILNELRLFILGKMLSFSRQELLRWVLQNYAQWVVRHAIDLYSGHQKGESLPLTEPESAPEEAPVVPLRLLLLGQSNSGKTSLINALFGDINASADVLPNQQDFTCYQLEHQDLPEMQVCESIGYNHELPDNIEAELAQADCILLFCKAQEAARQADQALMTRFHSYFHTHPEIAPPPLLVLCTHIDKLSPFREWQPPYNIAEPQSSKAHNIRAAMEAIAEELPCALSDIIPVNLQQRYNVEDGVIPALLERLPQAQRSQYLRSLQQHEQSAFWTKLGSQAKSSGQVIGSGMKFVLGQAFGKKGL